MKIYSSGHVLLGIINDILDLSKIETGRFEIMPTLYDTASLINDTVQLNIMRIGSKAIEFRISVSADIPGQLFGDELRIKQVLNNLLSNAFKYTEKGLVCLDCRHEMGEDADTVWLVFSIRDTGQGLTEAQIARLFDDYSRFDLDKNRATEGTGLGMSITKSLIDMMAGKLKVESEKGIGSTFTLSIPQGYTGGQTLGRELAKNLESFRFAADPRLRRQAIEREPMPYGRVLVVDDVETNSFVATGLMKPYGLGIEVVSSGFAALEKLENGAEYDIIFMDHMMPEMDGIETTGRIRKLGYQKPVVALTANAIVGQAGLFEKFGFDGFLSKPIDIVALDDVLLKYVRDSHPEEAQAVSFREAARQMAGQSPDAVAGAGDTTPAAEDTVAKSVYKHYAALRAVAGLEMEQALDAMGGLIDVYVSAVRLSARLMPETMAQMDACMADADAENFAVQIHGLKSVLRNIGAFALGLRAGALETEAKDGILPVDTYAAFRQDLGNFHAALTTALAGYPDGAGEPQGQLDEAAYKATLSAAQTAAADFDSMAALKLLRPFAAGLAEDAALQAVIQALEVFDCEGAAQLLAPLLDS